MSQHRDEYRQWPFVTQEEFELACAYFERRYMRAELGPTRQKLKIRSRRTLTTGNTHIEILRLLTPPDDGDALALAFMNLGMGTSPISDMDMKMDLMAEDDDQEALSRSSNGLPPYSLYSHQPYVTYEIHRSPTYQVPTLWFTLHDLPVGETTFDINSVYRYLVPDEYKNQLREIGIIGGISAAPHPITDLPAFFIHPCQTKEALEGFDCPLEDYLMIWIGLVGACVGLWIPAQMALGGKK